MKNLKKYKCDFHIHVKGDPKDRNLKHTVKELIIEAEKQKFDILAITNHMQIFNISKYQKFAKQHNILLINGIEINIKFQHVIVLFPHKSILKVKTFSDLKKYKENNPQSIIIAPHPYYKTLTCLGANLKKNINLFDAIEYCHFYTQLLNAPNKKALKIAHKYNKAIVGSSDVHKMKFFGTTYTELSMAKPTHKNIKKAITNYNFTNYISNPLPFITAIYYISKSLLSCIFRKLFPFL